MIEFWHNFILTFVPLFIVIDALGTLPVVITLGEGLTLKERHKMINVATITAIVVGLAFLFFGQFILNVMGISVGAFAIAGGLILLILSIKLIITGRMVDVDRDEMVAVVPIGTPLTAGPATIATLLLLAMQYPLYIVLISFAANMLIAWVIFLLGNRFSHFFGKGGLGAISKVFSLLLAAIAVSMIINGLQMLELV